MLLREVFKVNFEYTRNTFYCGVWKLLRHYVDKPLLVIVKNRNHKRTNKCLPRGTSIRFLIRNTFQILGRLYQMIRSVWTVSWETWWHKWKYELLINQLGTTNTAITRTWSRYIVLLLLLLHIILLLLIDWQVRFY